MTEVAGDTSIRFRALQGDMPGGSLREIFEEYWPAYRKWMHRASPLAPAACLAAMREHVPEILPIHELLVESFDGDEEVARFLTMYGPPRVVRGCSQLVVDDDGPLLLRSYDHHPRLFDGLVLHARWGETTTLSVTDCLWGALDGVNDRGLAVALAFGGRNAIGPGFGAPLMTRYLLETCGTVEEAKAALARVPTYMPYTYVVADAKGKFVTAHAGPDRPTRFVSRRTSTNHDSEGDWPEYCRHTRSVERLRRLESMLGPDGPPATVQSFLQPPLWRDESHGPLRTLYVAAYRPARGSLTLHWPGHAEAFGIDDFEERAFLA